MKFSSELTNILEALPDTALLINYSGEMQFANSASEKIFGFPPSELAKKHISLLIPKHFSHKETPITRIDHDSEGKRKDGSTFPIRFSIGELKQENERFFIAIVFDITDIKENENRLLLSEERALLSQRFANIGYWDWSIASGDLFWSERIAPMFGHSVGTLETSYENFLNAIHPEDRERVTHAVNECVNNGAAYEIEHRVVWPDGTTRWLLERGDVIRDKSNHPVRMLGVVQDITSRKELEEELLREKLRAEEGTRVKSTFLANMSHEIRTPMNSILGFVELALDDESVSENIRTHLKTAHRSARGLLGLINDILDVSKLEEGKVEIDESIIYLPRYLKETLQILRFKAEEKALTLSLELDPKLYQCIISDQNRIRQVLINIIGNSIKFTKKGGITLSVIRAGDNYLLFEITDTGIGMTESQVEKIFDPFTQADESTARLFGGTGLGTTISKQLVELMGGEIWVQSKLGEGTTFSFTIKYKTPQCAENCDSSCGKHADVGETTLPQLTRSFNVLIADDISENATLVAIRLKQQGSTVQIAINGKEAVEFYKNGDFDLILMDVQMPVMDGLEATGEIRRLEKKTGKHVPIIALTASVMISEQKSCIESGMDDVVSKPIEFYELFNVIEKTVPKDKGKTRIEHAST